MNYPFGRNLLLSSVGFERIIDAFEKQEFSDAQSKPQAYPPYNILKKSDHRYAIEIAVAGFSREELDITFEANKLNVKGKVLEEGKGEYLYKGIATRDFTHQFALAETVVVRNADLKNGLLLIDLENVIPEEKLPRKIPIGNTIDSAAKQLEESIA
jgi:molecular chaperone IbpA